MTFLSKPCLKQLDCPERQPFLILNPLGKKKRFKIFVPSEDGVSTIESLIWLPVYAFILFLVLNVSMLFFTQSQLLRVVQDSNRLFSVARTTTLTEVEQYVTEQVAYLGATATVKSQLVDGIIYTDLEMPVTALMPFSMLHKFFVETTVVISAQQIVEF